MRFYRTLTSAILAICLAIVLLQCQPEITREPSPTSTRSMKGYELYSRQVEDVWYFSLLPGTNRLKTYAEISSPEVQVRGLEALKLVLDRLAGGEQLFWSAGRVPNTEFPPADLVGEVQAHCELRGLDLQLITQPEVTRFIETPPAVASEPTGTPTPLIGGWRSYENPIFAISLEHPPHWQVDAGHSSPELGDTKLSGDDGFFIIGAMDGVDLDTVTASAAHHRLQPYGAAPDIETLTIQGQPARLILPSEDQYPGMENQAELIIQYPEPVSITGHACRYFSLAADRDHILAIAQTLRFVPTEVAPPPAATPLITPTVETPAVQPPATPAADLPATPQPPELTEPSQPEIHLFELSPDDRLDFGDTVTVRWSVSGAMHLFFCYRYATQLPSDLPHDLREEGGECFGTIPADCHMRDADGKYLYSADDEKCSFLPTEGVQQVTLLPFDEGEVYYLRFWMDAMSGVPDPETRYSLHAPILEDRVDLFVPASCPHQWFMSNPPQWCPAAPPWSIEATAQNFENGVMVFLPPHDAAPNAVHAFYTDEGELRQATLYNVSPEPPDPALAPPAGLTAPDAQFYPVWESPYAQTSLRATMGWASGEPFSFTWISQVEQGPDSYDAYYVKMPDNSVYRHDQMERMWTRWE